MKITEEIERECCDPKKDLILYRGEKGAIYRNESLSFCVHCGKIWRESLGERGSILETIIVGADK